jgi:hypothetical protein
MDDLTENVETLGIVIGVLKDGSGEVSSADVFTVDYGITRWFNRTPRGSMTDCLFEDVEILGQKITETAGRLYGMKILSSNGNRMKKNGSYDHGKTFLTTLRSLVFDGIPLDSLFIITGQAIKNFSAGFDKNSVLFKALYLLGKEEGYAVEATWMNSLAETDRILASDVICSGLPEISLPSDKMDSIEKLINSLQRWMLSL